MPSPSNRSFVERLRITYPVICGAMYPCSNPELVAAVSEAGGLGVVQPLSFIYVYGWDLRKGLQEIRRRTQKPYGFNALIEKSSRRYEERMKAWVDIALEEGCRFFVTALGNPRWVLERAKPLGGQVFHDVTERRWALKALKAGVDGLICVNNRAGGHAGRFSPQELFKECSDLGVPLVCAGGVGNEQDFVEAMGLGYSAVQMGTRFITTPECGAHQDYKDAILRASAKDIVKTERITGVPLSVIRTPYVDSIGLEVGPIARFFLKHSRTKYWMRSFYNLRAFFQMKRSARRGLSSKDYYQAGMSADHIESIEPAGDIVRRFGAAWAGRDGGP